MAGIVPGLLWHMTKGALKTAAIVTVVGVEVAREALKNNQRAYREDTPQRPLNRHLQPLNRHLLPLNVEKVLKLYEREMGKEISDSKVQHFCRNAINALPRCSWAGLMEDISWDDLPLETRQRIGAVFKLIRDYAPESRRNHIIKKIWRTFQAAFCCAAEQPCNRSNLQLQCEHMNKLIKQVSTRFEMIQISQIMFRTLSGRYDRLSNPELALARKDEIISMIRDTAALQKNGAAHPYEDYISNLQAELSYESVDSEGIIKRLEGRIYPSNTDICEFQSAVFTLFLPALIEKVLSIGAAIFKSHDQVRVAVPYHPKFYALKRDLDSFLSPSYQPDLETCKEAFRRRMELTSMDEKVFRCFARMLDQDLLPSIAPFKTMLRLSDLPLELSGRFGGLGRLVIDLSTNETRKKHVRAIWRAIQIGYCCETELKQYTISLRDRQQAAAYESLSKHIQDNRHKFRAGQLYIHSQGRSDELSNPNMLQQDVDAVLRHITQQSPQSATFYGSPPLTPDAIQVKYQALFQGLMDKQGSLNRTETDFLFNTSKKTFSTDARELLKFACLTFTQMFPEILLKAFEIGKDLFQSLSNKNQLNFIRQNQLRDKENRLTALRKDIEFIIKCGESVPPYDEPGQTELMGKQMIESPVDHNTYQQLEEIAAQCPPSNPAYMNAGLTWDSLPREVHSRLGRMGQVIKTYGLPQSQEHLMKLVWQAFQIGYLANVDQRHYEVFQKHQELEERRCQLKRQVDGSPALIDHGLVSHTTLMTLGEKLANLSLACGGGTYLGSFYGKWGFLAGAGASTVIAFYRCRPRRQHLEETRAILANRLSSPLPYQQPSLPHRTPLITSLEMERTEAQFQELSALLEPSIETAKAILLSCDPHNPPGSVEEITNLSHATLLNFMPTMLKQACKIGQITPIQREPQHHPEAKNQLIEIDNYVILLEGLGMDLRPLVESPLTLFCSITACSGVAGCVASQLGDSYGISTFVSGGAGAVLGVALAAQLVGAKISSAVTRFQQW